MKLCPQCDFIYENDQSLCDMDGADLVYDPTPFPSAKNAGSNLAAISSGNSRSWRLAASVVVGLVLGTVLFLLYHVSLHPTSPQSSNDSSAQVANNSPEQVSDDSAPAATDDSGVPSNLDLSKPVPLTPPIDATPAPSTLARKASTQSQSPASLSKQLPQLSTTTAKANSSTSAAEKLSPSPSRLPAPKREERKRKPAPASDKPKAAHQQNDSSIGSFLKKTGRIFKKPFKF